MKKILAALLIIAGCFTQANACLEVMVADSKNILAGNNEDYWNYNTKIWYYPATKGEYGRVCVGYDQTFGFVQGGMNDQGLFIDGNALDFIESWKIDPNKPDFQDSLDLGIDNEILAHCATVDDAVAFFQKYNIPGLSNALFPIADALGNSVVIEWSQGKLKAVKRTGKYQIATNFVQSDFSKMEDYPCDRYKIADKILSSAPEMNLETVKKVLSATHQEGSVNTVYSNICDLKNKKMYLYYFHFFDQVLEIDLASELKKGKHGYDIPTLFPIKPYSAIIADYSQPKSGREYLKKYTEKHGLDSALIKYEQLKTIYLDNRLKVDISEEEINELGYSYMKENKFVEALAFFKINVKEYPDSWNAYDSIGEVYMKMGNKEESIKNYEKSLSLNPNNIAGIEALKKLKP